MFPILALLFILVPAVEIAVIVQVGQRFGLGATLALIILTAMVGAWLAKSQGRDVMQKLQSSFGGEAHLGQTLIEGLLIFVAGLTLLAPGFITDAIGIAFLVPPIRQQLATRLARSGWLKQRVAPIPFSSPGPREDSDYDPPPPGVIDV